MLSAASELASLIALLRQAGLSDAEIARQAKLSRGTLWRATTGDCRAPLLGTYLALAGVYVSVIGKPPPPPRLW